MKPRLFFFKSSSSRSVLYTFSVIACHHLSSPVIVLPAASCGVTASARGGSELLALVGVSNAVERSQTMELATAAAVPAVAATDVAGDKHEALFSSELLPSEPSAACSNGTAACRRSPPSSKHHGGGGTDGRSRSRLPRKAYNGGGGGGGGDCCGAENGAMQHTRPQQQQQQHQQPLTEPFVAWCVSRDMSPSAGLFLSASMPCRDVEAFADSGLEDGGGKTQQVGDADAGGVAGGRYHGSGGGGGGDWRLSDVASNRGASGIDGVVSSAMGYAAGLRAAVTLVIGDMATLHDLGSLHALGGLDAACCPVTVVCVNNGGELGREGKRGTYRQTDR